MLGPWGGRSYEHGGAETAYNLSRWQHWRHRDRATGIWYISGPWTHAENNHAIWMMARYDDDYVKIDGEWKYQHLRAGVRMLAERQAISET